MKTLKLFLMVVFAAVSVAAMEKAGKTPADLYTQSYAAQMRNQMAYQSSAAVRAEAYGARYQRCDADHECGKNGMLKSASVPATAKGEEGVNPFLLIPLWQ